ncbi:MAG: holo-ACP synthase [Clostridiales bacterium]|nr:holo-ACP synthase [Clostridiales bacterium]
MILGVGLDLCDVGRIGRALNNPRFLQRIYTERERSQIERGGAQTAAGLFAAKEAVAKALGTGFSGFMPWDVEVARDDLGRPCAALSRGALARMEALGGRSVLVSITHSGGFAAAVAILTDEEPV